MKGVIKRLIKEKRFGFIQNTEGLEYFFHQSGLKNRTFDEVQAGDTVEFEDADTDKGLRAEDIYVD